MSEFGQHHAGCHTPQTVGPDTGNTMDLKVTHFLTNTDGSLGESCDVCHGTGAQFAVDWSAAFPVMPARGSGESVSAAGIFPERPYHLEGIPCLFTHPVQPNDPKGYSAAQQGIC